MTDHKDQRMIKRFGRLERGLQPGQIIGWTEPYGDLNLKNDTQSGTSLTSEVAKITEK